MNGLYNPALIKPLSILDYNKYWFKKNYSKCAIIRQQKLYQRKFFGIIMTFLYLFQNSIENCPILQPSAEQFANFEVYVERIKQLYEKDYGMVKVVAPKCWKPRRSSYQQPLSNLIIKNPIQQNPEGKMGVYQFKHISLPSISFSSFIQEYQSKQQSLKQKSVGEIQSLFWKNVLNDCPVYGADLLGTLMDETAGTWQLNDLNTILKKGISENIKGVNSSYCYIGSWKALFCWHKEDLDLDAINYLHFGKSKFWYCIQNQNGTILEKEARRQFFKGFDICSEYLRHKTCLINPYSLKKSYPNLKITKIQQKPGQFIIAFSGAYHCGFNFGINVAQAVNFATMDWLTKLKKVKYCKCKKSSVKIPVQLVIGNLIKTEQYRNHPLVVQLRNELQSQQQKILNLPKSKKILKAPKQNNLNIKNNRMKKVKKGIKVDKYEEMQVENIQQKTQIQCDECQAWHELQPSYDHLKDQPYFDCKMLHKQCAAISQQEKQHQDKLML